jgi:predicted nucleic acid-binding protein
MRFWDSSALLPLALHEPASAEMERLLRADPDLVLWWAAPVECASALARGVRQGRLSLAAEGAARAVVERLKASAFEVRPLEEVRARAARLLALHPLRAADALQLAAALVWCRERTADAPFVCLEDRLRLAAAREGFRVLPYAEEVNEGRRERRAAT